MQDEKMEKKNLNKHNFKRFSFKNLNLRNIKKNTLASYKIGPNCSPMMLKKNLSPCFKYVF